MASRAHAGLEGAVIELDYKSADGPTVTHVRGGLLAASLQVLRDAGLYDAYLLQLPAKYHDLLQHHISASWLPMALAVAHCAVLDAMQLQDSAMVNQGESIGSTWSKVLYSVALKTTRTLGTDVGWLILRQCGRLMQRVYKGGGCTLVRVGPKEALLEIHGLPLVTSPYFRTTHHASMRVIAQMTGGRVRVQAARARQPDPYRIATSYAWE